jgi:hypothetical protein
VFVKGFLGGFKGFKREIIEREILWSRNISDSGLLIGLKLEIGILVNGN